MLSLSVLSPRPRTGLLASRWVEWKGLGSMQHSRGSPSGGGPLTWIQPYAELHSLRIPERHLMMIAPASPSLLPLLPAAYCRLHYSGSDNRLQPIIDGSSQQLASGSPN